MNFHFSTSIVRRGSELLPAAETEVLAVNRVIDVFSDEDGNSRIWYERGQIQEELTSDDDIDTLLGKIEKAKFFKVTIKTLNGQEDLAQVRLLNMDRCLRLLVNPDTASDTDITYDRGGQIPWQYTVDESTTVIQAAMVDATEQALVYKTGDGTAALPSYSFILDPNTGAYSVAADTYGISTGGTLRFSISTAAVTSTLPYVAPAGTAAAPAYTFTGDTNTGFYSVAAEQIGVSVTGVLRVTFNAANVTSSVVNLGPNGAVGAPTYSFTNESDCGLYVVGANAIGMSIAGALAVTFNASGVIIPLPTFADEAAAAALATGQFYKTATGEVRIKL